MTDEEVDQEMVDMLPEFPPTFDSETKSSGTTSSEHLNVLTAEGLKF